MCRRPGGGGRDGGWNIDGGRPSMCDVGLATGGGGNVRALRGRGGAKRPGGKCRDAAELTANLSGMCCKLCPMEGGTWGLLEGGCNFGFLGPRSCCTAATIMRRFSKDYSQ